MTTRDKLITWLEKEITKPENWECYGLRFYHKNGMVIEYERKGLFGTRYVGCVKSPSLENIGEELHKEFLGLKEKITEYKIKQEERLLSLIS